MFLVAVVLREIFPLEMTSSFHCGFLLLILCLHPEVRGHDPQPQAYFTPSSLGLSPFLIHDSKTYRHKDTMKRKSVNIQATLLNKQLFQGDYLLLFMMTDYLSDFPQHMSPEEIRYSTFLKQGQEKMFL